jgi:hypothetical protein
MAQASLPKNKSSPSVGPGRVRQARPPRQPPAARRVAVPWRAGQDWMSRVRSTVSPENLPVTLEARACLDRRRSASVVPEKVPSGISTRFCIGTVVLACETVPESCPRRLVRRTSQSPQRREPELPAPCTVQTPSAGWACAGEIPENHTHPAISRKDSDPRNTGIPL